jgi:hypothetical protein
MMVGKVLMIASWLAGLIASAFVIFVICKLAWDEIKPEKKDKDKEGVENE